MTRWAAGRNGAARAGAVIAILVLLLVGLAVYSTSGSRLVSSLRSSLTLPSPEGISTSMVEISSLANVLKNLSSWSPSTVFPGSSSLGIANATSNWAGYVLVAGAGHPADFVAASWTLPQVSCAPTGTSGVLIWVGLGGLSGSSVQQIGTVAYCDGGQATYSAWYESYPTDKGLIILDNVNPAPGQQISASVAYSAATNGYTYTISAGSQPPYSFSESYANVKAPYSAEWIVEAPFAPDGPKQMSNFGTATFLQASATVGNRTDGIIGFTGGSDAYPIRSEYACRDLTTKASPGPLTGNSGFAVVWHQGGSC